MVEKGSETSKTHTLAVRQRKGVELTGVTDVTSFDEAAILLVTDCGVLTVEGEGLHIDTLDIARGVVEITGLVSALYYSTEAREKRGWREKLFG